MVLSHAVEDSLREVDFTPPRRQPEQVAERLQNTLWHKLLQLGLYQQEDTPSGEDWGLVEDSTHEFAADQEVAGATIEAALLMMLSPVRIR